MKIKKKDLSLKTNEEQLFCSKSNPFLSAHTYTMHTHRDCNPKWLTQLCNWSVWQNRRAKIKKNKKSIKKKNKNKRKIKKERKQQPVQQYQIKDLKKANNKNEKIKKTLCMAQLFCTESNHHAYT